MGCGVLEHDEYCLCDVIITEFTPVNYGTDNHWLLSMVAKHFELDLCNSPENFEFLLDKCLEFLVAYQVNKGVFDTHLYKKRGGHPWYAKDHGEAPAMLYQRVRQEAESVILSRQGSLSVCDLRDILGLETDKFLEYVSYGKQEGLTMERMQSYLDLRRTGLNHRASSVATGFTNFNRKTGVNGWLCRTFIDPYDRIEA